jgi:hypothetical protein
LAWACGTMPVVTREARFFTRGWDKISPGQLIDERRLCRYSEIVKPEEWLQYEEMYASMREALGTPRLVFEIGPEGLYGHPPARLLLEDGPAPTADPRAEGRGP